MMGPRTGRRRVAAGGKPLARKTATPAKESRAARYQRILAEMEAQIAVLKASLDGAACVTEAARVPEEVEAG